MYIYVKTKLRSLGIKQKMLFPRPGILKVQKIHHLFFFNPYKELTTLGKNLHAIHFQDNGGKYDEHIAPFFGTLNVDAVIRGLIDAGYTGPLTFESDSFCPYRDGHGDDKLKFPPLRVKRAAISLLYEIGAAALEAYGIEAE